MAKEQNNKSNTTKDTEFQISLSVEEIGKIDRNIRNVENIETQNNDSVASGIILLNICARCQNEFKPTNSMTYETLCVSCLGKNQNIVEKNMSDRITFDATNTPATKTALTEERVIHTTEYMHKDIPDGTEICLLKYPLTLKEWNQILRNQEIIAKLPEMLKIFLTETIGATLDDKIEKKVKMMVKTELDKI